MKQTEQTKQSKSSSHDSASRNLTVVGIGSSAGGLEAVTALLRALPAETGKVYVLVQHLDPNRQSLLPGLVAKHANIPVEEAVHNQKVKPNHVYVMPHDKDVTLSGSTLKLAARAMNGKIHMPINNFFQSLAASAKKRAIGVILSGTASDGTSGCGAIKKAGGVTIAQDATAGHQGMPQAAINSGDVDFIMSPDGIAEYLGGKGGSQPQKQSEEEQAEAGGEEDSMQRVFTILHSSKNVDFRNYKTTTTWRRIHRRMSLKHIDTLEEYIQYLQQDNSEQDALHQDLLINVTSFFRDPDTLQFMKDTVLPRLFKHRTGNEPIRVWVPGCAAGQEAYSLAIILSEFIAEKSLHVSMQIFGTDVNKNSVEKARAGVYSPVEVANVSPERLERFFEVADDGYRISKSIRRVCIFAPQNVFADPPFSRLDIISCCNLLIYLNAGLQEKIIRTFQYALEPNGYLVLGASESIGGSEKFTRLDKQQRVYSRKQPLPASAAGASSIVPEPAAPASRHSASASTTQPPAMTGEAAIRKEVDSLLLNYYTPASVVVDDELEIIQFRGSTEPYLGHSSGTASLSLIRMARHGLAFELRSAIHKVRRNKQPFKKTGILLEQGGRATEVGFEVIPVNGGQQSGVYYLILFSSADKAQPEPDTAFAVQQEDASRAAASNRRVEQLQQELTQAREDMRALTEDQEAANEELQTANEEIVSRNEELQSINEELETSKEEIEASNEELVTVNQELRSRNEEVAAARHYAETIIRTVMLPLLVLDGDLRVKSANRAFCQTFKVSENATTGKLLYQIGDDQWDIPSLRTLLSEVLPRSNSFDGYEIEHTFPSIGHKIMVLNARKFHRNGDNILLVIEDVTRQREQTRQKIDLEKNNAMIAKERFQLKELNAIKDEFISLASHQLRTPATAVKQYVGMVLEGFVGHITKRQRQMLKAAFESNDRQLKIVDDLLKVARVDQGRVYLAKLRCDIGALLEDIIAAQYSVFQERGQRLHFTPPKRKVMAEIDPALMRMVVENILDNASKYSPCDTSVEVGLEQHGKQTSVSVKDNGIGIYKKDLKKVFDKFARAESGGFASPDGSGLGLYWAKRIVELHGGTIEVDSRKGHGSVFTVTTPSVSKVQTK